MDEITRPMALDETLQDVAASLKILAAKSQGAAKVYGFRINTGGESDPTSIIKYIGDAVGMTPGGMNYDTGKFDYGSWEDVWFVRDTKPCILGQDGVVQAYLNKNDYTKDIYGNTVTIDENLTDANVMIEFPKIWMKIVPIADEICDVYISQVKIDDGYTDYPYIDHNGVHKEHFYMPAYNGSLINDVLRSVSGQSVMNSKTAQQEVSYALANGVGWYTELLGQIILINNLLLLMSGTTDSQTAYGRGIDMGSQTAFNAYITGTGNTKGFFWGSNDGTQLMKVLGMENWVSFQWRRYGGHFLVNNVTKIKLCYGKEDGSTTDTFNFGGSGYITLDAPAPSGTSGGYIGKMYFSKYGMFPSVMDASSSTKFCDACWYSNGITSYALRGGGSNSGLPGGLFALSVGIGAGGANWDRGVAPSFV